VASPFEVLGVDPDADDAEIVDAYRREVKESHPDHGGSASEFHAVQTAYERIQAGYSPDESADSGVDAGDDPASEPDYPASCRVEYLNYEVLADRGWALEDDPFGKATTDDLARADYGRFVAHPPESLLEAAEHRGFAWPYACRGGACANCAVAVLAGEISQPVDHILPPEMLERNIRLSCNGVPLTEELRVVYNLKHLPSLAELRLPPHPFRAAHPGTDVGTD